MATYLSERISELSAKMRSNVTARPAAGPTAPGASNMAATDIAKAHAMPQPTPHAPTLTPCSNPHLMLQPSPSPSPSPLALTRSSYPYPYPYP